MIKLSKKKVFRKILLGIESLGLTGTIKGNITGIDRFTKQ